MVELVLAFSFSLIVVGTGLHALFSLALGTGRAGTKGYQEKNDGVLSRRARLEGALGYCLSHLTSQEPTLNFLGSVRLNLTEKEGEALGTILQPYADANLAAAEAVQEVAEALEKLEEGKLSEVKFRGIVNAAEAAKQRRKTTGRLVAPQVVTYLRPYLRSYRSSESSA